MRPSTTLSETPASLASALLPRIVPSAVTASTFIRAAVGRAGGLPEPRTPIREVSPRAASSGRRRAMARAEPFGARV